jgi:membrane protein implicated in regulation of membrane protease activity
VSDTDRRISAVLGWVILAGLVLSGAAWLLFGFWIAGAVFAVALWVLYAAYVEDRKEPPSRQDGSAPPTRSTPSGRS